MASGCKLAVTKVGKHMKHRMKMLLMAALCCMIALCLAGCQIEVKLPDGVTMNVNDHIVTSTAPGELETTVSFDANTNGAYLAASAADLEAAGFSMGDSLKLTFGNGFVADDIPLHTGYYIHTGQTFVNASSSLSSPVVSTSPGDFWHEAGLNNGDTCTITISKAGKYAAVEKAFTLKYTDSRQDYSSDVVFANFRMVQVGNMAPGVLYRSCSPVNNLRGRAAYADGLISEVGVKTVLNLSDSWQDMQGYMAQSDFSSRYYQDLFNSGSVVSAVMDANYKSPDFMAALGDGLREMMNGEAPYDVHCTEGKDRTGIACLLLGALCGATYDELLQDYMLSYENYYGVTQDSDPEIYEILVDMRFNEMIRYFAGTVGDEVPTTYQLQQGAWNYLSQTGLTDYEISQLQGILCGW